MKTRLFTVFIMITLFLCGCSNSTTTNYDGAILQLAEQQINQFGYVPNRTYSVDYADNGLYVVDINGTEYQIQIPSPSNSDKIVVMTGDELGTKEQKIWQNSKELIYSYIDSSNILQDKDEIKDFISNISAYIAEIDVPALYEDGKFFIGRNYVDATCEWMICHELVHAIADFTNGGVENERYAYNLFNEVMTDIITASMNPKLEEGVMSVYMDYSSIGYSFIGCFGEDALESYFYGYSDIIEIIGNEHELDFFVLSLDNAYSNEFAMICINNSINHWYECAQN